MGPKSVRRLWCGNGSLAALSGAATRFGGKPPPVPPLKVLKIEPGRARISTDRATDQRQAASGVPARRLSGVQ
jgi:hypothetical protein